jgi:hypothetical protein
VSHFRKLDQQTKVTSENEGSRPFKYTRNKEGVGSFNIVHKQVHGIDSNGSGPPENWDKNFRPLRSESKNRIFDSRKDHQQNRGGYPSRGRGIGRFQEKPLYCMFHEKDTVHRTRYYPIFLESKMKMAQKQNQPSASSTAKEVHHTSHYTNLRNHHP